MSTWSEVAGENRGPAYTARFARLAARGTDVHGEANLCTRLLPGGGAILDAGCGTGRVAIRLAETGYDCVGVDVDPAMLAEARRLAPDMEWIEADLASFVTTSRRFDLIVAAGNVIPLLTRGTEAAAIGNLADALVEGGLLVAGFGLDRAHLPIPEAPFGLARYDDWCADAGLTLAHRYATWDEHSYDGGGYAVSVHVRQSMAK